MWCRSLAFDSWFPSPFYNPSLSLGEGGSGTIKIKNVILRTIPKIQRMQIIYYSQPPSVEGEKTLLSSRIRLTTFYRELNFPLTRDIKGFFFYIFLQLNLGVQCSDPPGNLSLFYAKLLQLYDLQVCSIQTSSFSFTRSTYIPTEYYCRHSEQSEELSTRLGVIGDAIQEFTWKGLSQIFQALGMSFAGLRLISRRIMDFIRPTSSPNGGLPLLSYL
jgi:hypothetical protein